MTETLFALELLVSDTGHDAFTPWRQRTRNRLSRRARSLLTMARTLRPVPDLLHMVEGAPGEEVRRQNVAAMLEDFHGVAVAPYWRRISARLEADCAARGQLVLSGGIERLLSTLHPGVRWRPGSLEVRGTAEAHGTPGREIDPQGRGLLLTPSLFLSGGPVLIDHAVPAGRPVLAYPVALDPATAAAMSSAPSALDTQAALGALVGQTRAAIMRCLTDCHNTTELGRELGISAAAASQHASVLRDAGLITTRRRLNTALHALTPLGRALLDGYHHQDLARVAFPAHEPPGAEAGPGAGVGGPEGQGHHARGPRAHPLPAPDLTPAP